MVLDLNYFHAAMESSDDAIIAQRLDGTVLQWNPAAERLYGYSAAEMLGANASLLIPPDCDEETELFQKKLQRKRRIYHHHTIRIRKGGERIAVAINASPVMRENKVVGAIIIAWDITESRQLQTRIRQQEVVTELSLMALSGMRRKTLFKRTVQEVSKALNVELSNILELSRNKLVVRGAFGWNNDLAINETVIDLGKFSQGGYALLSKKPVIVPDIQIEKRFKVHPLLFKNNVKSGMSVVIGTEERLFGVLSVFSKHERHFTKNDTNFTQAVANVLALAVERKRLERQKDEFIAIASHELKTPITSVKIFAQVLERKFNKIGDILSARLLNKMDIQLNKLSTLITDLLDVSKVEAGQLKFNNDLFDPNTLILDVIEEMQRTTSDHVLVADLQELPVICGDRYRIGQVIINLVSNAIKYSPESKSIVLTSRLLKDRVRVCVKDSGIGIPHEIQEKVFERFFRASGDKQETYPGMGLGLYISSEIVKRQGGKIWVRSTVGKGSTFCFTLPLNKA